MKKIILMSILFCNSVCYSQNGKAGIAKSDSMLITKIKSGNPNNYIGRILNDYLSNDFLKAYKEWSPVDEPPGKLFAIILSYSKKVWVEITFTEILHQKRFNEKRKWRFELLKKEKIAGIKYSWEE